MMSTLFGPPKCREREKWSDRFDNKQPSLKAPTASPRSSARA
jgi:hypothetical protein